MNQTSEIIGDACLVAQNFIKTKKRIATSLKLDKNTKRIVSSYLDLVIDDRIGMLDNKIFIIDLEDLLDFLKDDNDKQEPEPKAKEKGRDKIKKKFLQGLYANMKVNEDYQVHRDGRFSQVILTPFGLRKFLMVSGTSVGKTIRQYFISIEKLYRQCLMEKVKYDDLEGVKMLIEQDLEQEQIKDDFTTALVDLELTMQDEECVIDIEKLFVYADTDDITKFKKNMRALLQQHKLPFEVDTIKKKDAYGRMRNHDSVYVSLDTIKYLILQCNKANHSIQLVKKYFIMAEQRVFTFLLQNQKLDYDAQCEEAPQRKNSRAPRKNSKAPARKSSKIRSCYFYIMRTTTNTARERENKEEPDKHAMNVFKYGIATEIAPRLSSYNVGRLSKAQFHYYVRVPDCVQFEKDFAKLMERYHVFVRREFIKVNEDFMIEKLKTILYSQ